MSNYLGIQGVDQFSQYGWAIQGHNTSTLIPVATIVGQGTDGYQYIANRSTYKILGITKEPFKQTQQDYTGPVWFGAPGSVIAGGPINPGDTVGSDANGHAIAIAVTNSTNAGSYTLGTALTASDSATALSDGTYGRVNVYISPTFN